MGFGDIFKIKAFKSEIENLNKTNSDLQSEITILNEMLTPEMKDATALKKAIQELNSDRQKLQIDIENQKSTIEDLKGKIANIEKEILAKKKLIGDLDDELALQDFGLYRPKYDFANSDLYKERLNQIRTQQKNYIKDDLAANYPTNLSYDGSVAKGKAMIKDNVKQILRSFNNECDVLIDKAKFNNVESIKTKIMKSFESLNKMNARLSISIKPSYLQLKIDELNLAYEYAMKKQEEKERQKEERERLREEAKLQKELEEARKNIEKEQKHYKNALDALLKQLGENPDDTDLIAKKEELEKQLTEIDNNLKDIDYREANKRAGYVYIISNIGSFGENVYKIGMTRRLEPLDRVSELGDASVPFNFDVHALIFSDDAPALENALHKAFEDKKVNMVNPRREFFKVSLAEIEEVVKQNYDKTVEFTRTADAEQYRETLIIKNNGSV
ncbi:MAG TPA: DUF4041 domain-containing protein [Lachnospiraceae bacterium]